MRAGVMFLAAVAAALCGEAPALRPEVFDFSDVVGDSSVDRKQVNVETGRAGGRTFDALAREASPAALIRARTSSRASGPDYSSIFVCICGVVVIPIALYMLSAPQLERDVAEEEVAGEGAEKKGEEKEAEVAAVKEPEFGPVWNLVFRQTHPALFVTGEWCRNPEDPSNDNFAILDRLEEFRVDGAFQFKLVWPDKEEQIWKQKSNPVTLKKGGVTGYEEVSVPYKDKGWGGLEHSGTHALVDGSVSAGGWYYAVGSFYSWSGGYPGPGGGQVVKKVELYVYSLPPGQRGG